MALNDDTKVTVTAGGQTAETTVGKLKQKAQPTIRRVEDLLEIHNDEDTTKKLNESWRMLRKEVDGRASLDEMKVRGELTITIKYEADSDTGKKDIEVLQKVTLPKPRSNKRTLYEDADGNLVANKPTKQTSLDFDNKVTPIRKSV